MLPDERMVEAARAHFYGSGYDEGVPGMLRVAFAALDREALIEDVAKVLCCRGGCGDLPACPDNGTKERAEAVLRAVGLIPTEG